MKNLHADEMKFLVKLRNVDGYETCLKKLNPLQNQKTNQPQIPKQEKIEA